MSTIETGRKIKERQPNDGDDPVLKMLGLGKELWQGEPGDDFVARLRSEDEPVPPAQNAPVDHAVNLQQTVWSRIQQSAGQQFHTVTGLPFTFEVEGNGIWFFRDGKRVERKLNRTQVDTAISRCPLQSTTEIKDLMDYAYLFALLKDGRIRGQSW